MKISEGVDFATVRLKSDRLIKVLLTEKYPNRRGTANVYEKFCHFPTIFYKNIKMFNAVKIRLVDFVSMSYQKINKQEIDVIQSMTGFASAKGEIPEFSWQIEIRSVNHRGLDIKLRAPDWVDGLESLARQYLKKQVARGALYVTINVRDETQEMVNSNPDPYAIQRSLNAIQLVENQAMELGMILAPSKASDVLLAILGNEDKSSKATNTAVLRSALMADFTNMVDTFIEARRNEGYALKDVLLGQSAQITTLLESLGVVLQTRKINLKENFQTQLKILIGSDASVDPQRLAQELATIIVKMDVTEEVDRLHVHVKSLHDLLSQGGVVGRKLEFLMQEFNREANTLCSKSQDSELTTLGLELKVIIDQMREQVQNVE